MGSNEFHEHPAKLVGHVDDQPVLVAAEIENQAVVGNEVDIRAELLFHIVWTFPARLADNCEPDADRSLRPPVALPELLQRPASDDVSSRYASP